MDGLIIENAIDCLPVGGALGAVELAVSPVTAVIKAAPLMKATLSGKRKMASKLFWRQSVPFRDAFI